MSSAANRDTLHNNLSDTSQTLRLSSANADLTQGVDGATANKQHRIDRAGTRQTYETAQENADQNPGVGFPDFRTGEADTTLTRDTGVAEADRTWRYSLASADRTQTRDNATHQKNSQIVQAGLQQSFSNNQALADASYETALAGHEQSYGSALLTADTARGTALGNAQLGWLNASFAADVTALTQLDTLNADAGDWTNHLVQLATAQQSWWSTFAPNFMAFVNDVTDEWADEQTAANLERAQLATANNLADLAYTADVANATYQASLFLADQSEQREFALADQDELFQQTEADARRTFDVTRAQIIHSE
jgi:hypothetical protein